MTFEWANSPIASRRSLLKGLALGGAVAGAWGLTGCNISGSSGDKVSFLNFADWIGENTISDFQKKYPDIKINQVTTAGVFEKVIPKIKQQPGIYDMALAPIDAAERALKLGLIEPMNFANVPNMKLIDPQYRDIALNGTADNFVATDYGKVGIGIRTDLVDEDIKSWSDLWRIAPKYKGKINLFDYEKDLMGTALLYLGYEVNSRKPAEIEAAGKALEKLKPFVGTIGESGIGSALVNGSAAIAVTYDYDVFAAQQENSNIRWVAPEEGLTGYLEGLVALSGTKMIDQIETFTNFHLAPKQYAAFIERLSIAYVEPGIADQLPKNLAESEILFPSEDVAARVTFQRYLGDADPLYNRAYTQFKAA